MSNNNSSQYTAVTFSPELQAIINAFSENKFLENKNKTEQLNIDVACDTNNDLEEVIESHDAEPIKDIYDINHICNYFLTNKQYRNYMLFVCGINMGLRVSDLRNLKFASIINEDKTFKDSFDILEQKTKNTRKIRKLRTITINKAIKQAVTVYLNNTENVTLDQYMFRSESNNSKNTNKPLTRYGIQTILEKVIKATNTNVSKCGTHMMRKTFGYHFLINSPDRDRALELLMKTFNHSSTNITLRYIGITKEEIKQVYNSLNLGI